MGWDGESGLQPDDRELDLHGAAGESTFTRWLTDENSTKTEIEILSRPAGGQGLDLSLI